MTKEKLEKEAEEWLNKWYLCNKCENKVDCISNFSYCKKVVLQSYLASAESREKRIADLEEKLANANNQLEDRDLEIKKLKEVYRNQDNKRIDELQKENAELIHENARLVTVIDNSKSWGISPLNALIINNLDAQLKQSKEIIRDFISVAIDYIDKEDKNYSFIVEAEQFLKENE